MLAFPCFVNSTKAPQKPHSEQSVRGSAWKARGLEGRGPHAAGRWPASPEPGNFSRSPLKCQLGRCGSGTSPHHGHKHQATGAARILSVGCRPGVLCGGVSAHGPGLSRPQTPGCGPCGPSLQRSRTRPRTERDQAGTGARSGASAPSRGLCLRSSRASLFCSHGQQGSKARS